MMLYLYQVTVNYIKHNMRAIYCTGFFILFCFSMALAEASERQALWKRYVELLYIAETEGVHKGLELFGNIEEELLSKYPDINTHVHIAQANCYMVLDQFDAMEQNIATAELLIEKYALDSLKAGLYRSKGLALWKNLDFESAILMHKEGLKSAKEFANARMEMKLVYNIGMGYKYLLKEDSARLYINKALAIATKKNDNIIKANCYTRLSDIEKDVGNLLKAMEHSFEAYGLAKIVTGDTKATRYQYLAVNLYDIYYNLGNLSSTLELINFIIEQRKALNHLIHIETHLLVKADLLLRMDSLDSSMSVLEELEQSHQISNNQLLQNQLSALKGVLLYKKQEWAAAEKELSKLLPSDRKMDKLVQERIVVHGLSQLAKLKFHKGDYNACILICEQELKGKRIGYDHKKQFLGTLAAAHKVIGNGDAAYTYLLQKDAVRDTINRFYEGTLRLSQEQEMLDQQKAEEIEKLKHKNELSQVETSQQRILFTITGILAMLISGMFYLWGRQRKLVLENSLTDVKQQLLKLQVNPHFIFNVLNSIQNSVLTLKKEKAIELISKFSKLTRQVLQNSDKEMVPIHEELLLLTNYMDLEKVRTQNKFDYEVMIDEGIDVYNQEIPSMILQLFVENAIWHGILPKEKSGLIKVRIERDNNRIKVIIEDDGIGRQMSINLKTKDQQEKVSMGLRLIKQRITTLNRKYKDNIELHVKDGMNGKGTQVLLIA